MAAHKKETVSTDVYKQNKLKFGTTQQLFKRR